MASVNFQESNFSRKRFMKGRKFKSLHWGCISSMCCVFAMCSAWQNISWSHKEISFLIFFIFIADVHIPASSSWGSYTNEMNTEQLNMSENLNMLTSLSITKIMNSTGMTSLIMICVYPADRIEKCNGLHKVNICQWKMHWTGVERIRWV